MDNVILTEEDGVGYDVPEAEHIETVFQGLDDSLATINGNESLTSAQVYLQSVLSSSGLVRASVAGNEGFLKTVGNGIKSAYDYIVKMFKSLWDFFFKRDAPKEVEAAKAAVKQAQVDIKVLDGTASEAEVDKALAKMTNTVKQLTHQEPDINKTVLDQILKEADAAHKGTFAEKKKAVLMIAHELPKISKNARKKLDEAISENIAVLKKVCEKIESLKDSKEVLVQKLGHDFTQKGEELQKGIGILEKARNTSDVNEYKGVLTHFLSEIDAIDEGVKAMKAYETDVKEHISELGKEINGAGEGKDGEKARKLSSGLSTLLKEISAIAKMLSAFLSRMTSLNVKFKAVFGL